MKQLDELVLEVQRLARRKTPAGVSLVHLAGSAYIKASAARYHYFRNGIGELAAARGADLFDLGRGRLCLVAKEQGDSTHRALMALLEAETEAWSEQRGPDSILEAYRLPEQYLELRERCEVLERSARRPDADTEAAGSPGDAGSGRPAGDNDARDGDAAGAGGPDPEAPPEPSPGPLTPALLARIESRLDGVDLAPFVRRQPVHHRDGDIWRIVYVEQTTSLAELARVFFPEVELHAEEPLFAELWRHLDRLTLLALLLNRPWRQQPLGLNLGHAAWSTDEFRRLRERLEPAERRRLTIELHWLDALRDQAQGGRVMAEMREAGFAIAIDRLPIDSLPLLNLDRLDADHLKLDFDRQRLALLLQPDWLAALGRWRPERVVLTRCDDPMALELGERLRITRFQGRLVDRLARAAAGAADGASHGTDSRLPGAPRQTVLEGSLSPR